MPKVGMEPIRRQALIRATIAEIGAKGSLDVTVSQIAKAAGVSSALAHHYFGSKNKLFLSAMRAILADYGTQARDALRGRTDARKRLEILIDVNFSAQNFDPAVIAAWLNFYVLAQTSPEAQRLLRIYQRRLQSNLRREIKRLSDDPVGIARTTAALIDGLYLREALRDAPPDAAGAMALVRNYVTTALEARRAGIDEGI